MGSGIAQAIVKQYPEAYAADCKTRKGDEAKLGTYTYCEVSGRKIFNLYTQYTYGTDRIQVRYKAVFEALEALSTYLDEHDPDHKEIVGLPRIGCGLAGGNWEIVRLLIEKTFPTRTIRIYTL
jgi:O-acetyl-ADP-ribose deacetylase (regulator of RNase III)